MFGRCVARGIAALLLVWLIPSGETAAFADVGNPAVTAAIDQTADQNADPARPPARDAAPAETKVAALDPAEPAVKMPGAAAAAIASPALPEPFGLHAAPVASGDVVTKWSGVEADIRAQQDILANCRDGATPCPPAAQNLLGIIAQGRGRTGRARIGVINRAVNLAIRPMSDLAQWGVPDRWSAPFETLTSRRGDCEDYAIVKYVALREAGVADADVRLVIVHDLANGQDHAVTAARLDGDWIMLDNRWLTLLEDRDMRHVVPLFVMDDAGIRQFVQATIPDAHHASAPAATAASAPASVGFWSAAADR